VVIAAAVGATKLSPFLRKGGAVVGRSLRCLVALASVAGVCALAVPAAGAGPVSGLVAAALPSCGATSHPFAAFGDLDAYCALPDNGLESGSAGWSLEGGAAVVAGNEPWYVSGFGSHSLDLPAGATATSPSVPVSLVDPYFRMFARSAGADGPLQVRIVFHGLTGNLTGALNVGSLAPGDYPGWAPTAAIPSLLALPLGTSSAQVQLTSLADGGDWQVDDLYVDPFAMRG
jgi:hypothetical protein